MKSYLKIRAAARGANFQTGNSEKRRKFYVELCSFKLPRKDDYNREISDMSEMLCADNGR